MFENTASAWMSSAKQGADHESGGQRGQTPHAQWTVCETGERVHELMHPDRCAVHQEIATARFAVLGEKHQCTGAVVDVNGRHPRPGLSKLQHTAASHDRLDHALAKP